MVGIVVDKPSPATRTLKFRDGEKMSVNRRQQVYLFMTDNHIDFEVGMKCYQVAWNKDRGKWEYELTTTKQYLENAVACFKTELSKQVELFGEQKNSRQI